MGVFTASQDQLVSEQYVDWFAHHFKSFNLIKVDRPHFLLQAKLRQSAKYILDFDQYAQAAKEIQEK
jgi:surfactin synthase thioesterase subunit